MSLLLDKIIPLFVYPVGFAVATGLVCLVFCLLAFIQTDTPLFGVSKDNAEHVRATVLVVAVWYALFCLPLMAGAPGGSWSGAGGATGGGMGVGASGANGGAGRHPQVSDLAQLITQFDGEAIDQFERWL